MAEFAPWFMLILVFVLSVAYGTMLKRLGILARKYGVRDKATVRHYRRYQTVGQIIVVCLLLLVFVPLRLSGLDLWFSRLVPLVIGGTMFWQMYLLHCLSSRQNI